MSSSDNQNNMGFKTKKEPQKLFELIIAIESQVEPTLADLCSATDATRPSLFRRLAQLRTLFNMTIEFVETERAGRGKQGFYKIESWGIISEEKFKDFYMVNREKVLKE